MEVVLIILKVYLVVLAFIMLVYTIRHFVFTMNRLLSEQRIYYQDILDTELPFVSVLVPMHNEEQVAAQCLEQLLKADYDRNRYEIIPINDHSTDHTKEIINSYAAKYPIVKPIHRTAERERGKPVALNHGMRFANGEIIVVFDADYLPPKGILKEIAISFKDPHVGAVMGRVVPINTEKKFLTRLLDLERTGGYQVDQQARYNLKLLPQYGGTVGGFRKKEVLALGGFDRNVLAEDTDLTFRLALNGYKVVYANRVECYEEVPEEWAIRARQIRRWSQGHNTVFFKQFFPMLASKHLTLREKIDGVLLLAIYAIPMILLLGLMDSLVLFFLGEMELLSNTLVLLMLGAYNTFGNFAPFFQVGTGCLLDGANKRILLIPFLLFSFFFNTWHISRGFIDAIIGSVSGKKKKWIKTKRFRQKEGKTK